MSTMLERVADALEPKCFGNGFTKRLVALELARAAIEAMREPTDAMAEFAEENFDRNGDDIKVCYRAFIHAALSQDTHSLPPRQAQAAKPAGSTPPSSPAGTNSTGDA